MPTVHGVPLSPFVRKVRVALFEKNVSHDVVPTIPLPPATEEPAFGVARPECRECCRVLSGRLHCLVIAHQYALELAEYGGVGIAS